MKDKIEQPKTTPVSVTTHEDVLSPIERLHKQIWKVSNFATVATATSAALLIVQKPVNSLLFNLIEKGTMAPPVSGGIYAAFKTLYAGTSAAASGSVIRTAYVTNTKKPVSEGTLNETLVKE